MINSRKTTHPLPQVLLVNNADEVVGTADKMAAHELGLLHRAFSIFVFNASNEVLLQQRSASKYHCGGLWTNTCCSHQAPSEPAIITAKKRLQYEMGITAELKHAGVFKYKSEFENGLIEHEIDHVYTATSNSSEPKLNPAEAQQYQWVSIPELEQNLASKPEMFTPWLPQALAIAIANI